MNDKIQITLQSHLKLDNDKHLDLEFNLQKNTFDIKINRRSAITQKAYLEEIILCKPITQMTEIPERITEKIQLLSEYKTTDISKVVAVLSNKRSKQNDIEQYINDNVHLPKTLTPDEYLSLDEHIQELYDILTPVDESKLEAYKFICNTIKSGSRHIDKLYIKITTQTETTKLVIDITGNNKCDIKLNQSIYKDKTWYDNLKCVDLKYFGNELLDDLNKYINEQMDAKNISNWDSFKVPMYICKLKNVNSTNNSYIATYFDKSEIPATYEILNIQYIPHPSYIEELSHQDTVTISACDTCDYIIDILNKIKNEEIK
jgi:hypothetical protein